MRKDAYAALCPFSKRRARGNEARKALVDNTDCSHPLTTTTYVAYFGLQLTFNSVETMLLVMKIGGGAL